MKIFTRPASFFTSAALAVFWLTVSISAAALEAEKAVFTEINLNFPSDFQKVTIPIRQEDALRQDWQPGEKIRVRIAVEHKRGHRSLFSDMHGQSFWDVVLDENREASLTLVPHPSNFTGALTVTGNHLPIGSKTGGTVYVLEKVYEHRFEDGARVKVHFTDRTLEESGEETRFAANVLGAAVLAYKTITQFQGFSSQGFSFANPDKSYAYDPDRTIDIYLGNPSDPGIAGSHGFANVSFKDAPCFDTIKVGESQYQAIVLVPANYREFIRNWEKINGSSLGPRNVSVDLKGTLVHEMLHALIFYYNKNLNKESDANVVSEAGHVRKHIDWYVEGLARYFETLVGAQHDFFSHGFKQTLPDKIRFSRGGSNYFMRYPDQNFTDLRYENALFWRFVHHRFGMGVIERMSRDLRSAAGHDFRPALEKATGLDIEKLLREYSAAALFRDFGLGENKSYLKEVARTRLAYENNNLYLLDGVGKRKFLGLVCSTDWIGTWSDVRAAFGDLTIAGDNTPQSDVSGWATDFFEIEPAAAQASLPKIGVTHVDGASTLDAQVFIERSNGRPIRRAVQNILKSETGWIDAEAALAEAGVSRADVRRIYVLVSNLDEKYPSNYQIEVR